MLLQNSPFRDFDSFFEAASNRTAGRPMPIDAYRRGDDVWVHIDLPGVTADSIDISVERSVLTVTAERSTPRQEGDRSYLAERHRGTFSRQVNLGDGLDAEAIEADYHDGVLSMRIPVAQQAKPRKIEITNGKLSIPATATESNTVDAS